MIYLVLQKTNFNSECGKTLLIELFIEQQISCQKT